MARLKRRPGEGEDPEPDVPDNGAQTRCLLCIAYRTNWRDPQTRKQYECRGGEHQWQHPLSRGRCERCSACDRGDDEAYGTPYTDAPIVEMSRTGGGEGNTIPERHQ